MSFFGWGTVTRPFLSGIPHRFLTGGFISDLTPDQLLLYFFLVLAAALNNWSSKLWPPPLSNA
jgi:hypothetical protein